MDETTRAAKNRIFVCRRSSLREPDAPPSARGGTPITAPRKWPSFRSPCLGSVRPKAAIREYVGSSA
jgi:hypothetical protein